MNEENLLDRLLVLFRERGAYKLTTDGIGFIMASWQYEKLLLPRPEGVSTIAPLEILVTRIENTWEVRRSDMGRALSFLDEDALFIRLSNLLRRKASYADLQASAEKLSSALQYLVDSLANGEENITHWVELAQRVLHEYRILAYEKFPPDEEANND